MFSIKDCIILWDKRKDTPKDVKLAVTKDLLGMSDLIWEAMDYTRDKALKGRDTEIRYHLSYDAYLNIFFEPSDNAWNITIYHNDTLLGEIVSEKWPLFQMLSDEDVEEEKLRRRCYDCWYYRTSSDGYPWHPECKKGHGYVHANQTACEDFLDFVQEMRERNKTH